MLDDDTEWTSLEAQMDDAEQSASDRGTERKEHSGSDVISELIDVDDLLDVDPDQVKSSLRAMISFFTVIKMDAGAEDIEAFEKNTWTIPLIGVLVGLVAFITGAASWYLGFSNLATTVLILAAVLLFSKFLHFDGLVDFGDALVASGDRDKHIRALKDTNIGAGGIGVALIVTLAAVALLSSFGIWLLLLVWPLEILVKNAMVAAAAWGEPGDGMASKQVGNADKKTLVKSSVFSLVAVIVFMFISLALVQMVTGIPYMNTTMYRWVALVALTGIAASIATGIGMASWANKELGFVNGDILGATNEVSRVMVLALIIIVETLAGFF